MKKIIMAFFFAGGILFSFVGCEDKENPVSDILQMANVNVTKNGEVTPYTFSVAAATSKSNSGDTAYTVIAASNITSQKPTMTIMVQGKAVGNFGVSINASALLGGDYSKILSNTVIVYFSEDEYVIMINGSINITSITDNIIQGTFSGTGINGKDIKDLDLTGIATLLLGGLPYSLEGSFKTAKVNF